jgi:hypothetical protein
MGVLDRWVEEEIAPGVLKVKDTTGCSRTHASSVRVPGLARYVHGDPGDSASFQCTAATSAEDLPGGKFAALPPLPCARLVHWFE